MYLLPHPPSSPWLPISRHVTRYADTIFLTTHKNHEISRNFLQICSWSSIHCYVWCIFLSTFYMETRVRRVYNSTLCYPAREKADFRRRLWSWPREPKRPPQQSVVRTDGDVSCFPTTAGFSLFRMTVTYYLVYQAYENNPFWFLKRGENVRKSNKRVKKLYENSILS